VTTRCSICRHPARVDIDVALTGGATIASVAREFGVHRSSVSRHAHAHLATALARVIDHGDDVSVAAIVDRATQLYGYCEALLDTAEAVVRRHPDRARAIMVTSAVIRETRATLVMVADTITATAGVVATESPPESDGLHRRMVERLRKTKVLWALADGTVEYSEPCAHCGYRTPPSGPLRDLNDGASDDDS